MAAGGRALKVELPAIAVEEAHPGQRARLEPGEEPAEGVGVAGGLAVVDVVDLEGRNVLLAWLSREIEMVLREYNSCTTSFVNECGIMC